MQPVFAITPRAAQSPDGAARATSVSRPAFPPDPMALTHAFIIDRASKTTAVAVTFTALWVWDEKTPAQHDALRIALETAESGADTLETAMLQARSNLDNALDQFHLWTVQALSLARVRTRHDAGRAASLSTLSAGGSSRRMVRDEGERWLAWWLKFDPAWVPMPGLTTAIFTALKVQIEGVDNPGGVSTPGLVDLYDTAQEAWRAQAETTNGLARTLEDVNEGWYAAATAVFAAGTPQGNLIRGQVPTTYTPTGNPPPPPPPPPAPTPLEIAILQQNSPTAATLTYLAGGGANATVLLLQYKLPADADFGHDTPVVQPSQQVTDADFAGALVAFRTLVSNVTGQALSAEQQAQF